MKDSEEISSSNKLQKQKEDEVRNIIRSHAASNTYLDLTNRSIYVIPDELFMLPNIEYLYLESNHLEDLPEDFFDNLPMLKWLDLRDNKLIYLPPSIGSHRYLKNVLLEKNQLTHLPLELGHLQTLTGLSLRGNPLIVPPPDIVEQGVQVILSYLLDELNAGGDLSERDDENGWRYADAEEYSDDEDDRFSIQSTQSGMRQYDNEIGLQGPTPVAATFHHPNSRNKRHSTPWRDKKLSGSPSGNLRVKDLNLANSSNRERKYEPMDRKNWLAKMQQKRQDTMVLDEWRQEAKRLQSLLLPNTTSEKTRPVPPYGIDGRSANARPVTEEERQIHVDAIEAKVDRVEPKNSKPKPAIEEVANLNISDTKKLPKVTHVIPGVYDLPLVRKQESEEKSEGGPTERQEIRRGQKKVVRKQPRETKAAVDRARIDNEVQQRMRQHTSQLRFRKQRNPNDSLLQPGRELQRELLDQKMSSGADLEYRFRAFTGDSSSFSSSKKTSSL